MEYLKPTYSRDMWHIVLIHQIGSLFTHCVILIQLVHREIPLNISLIKWLYLIVLLFSNTYNDVASNSSQFWKYQRHSLIMEYSQRSPAPPPFSLFGHFFIFFRWIYRQCIGKTRKEYAGLSECFMTFRFLTNNEYFNKGYLRWNVWFVSAKNKLGVLD